VSVGGLTVIDVPSREEAHQWAAKWAAACRCDQEIWELGFDPKIDAMLGEAATGDNVSATPDTTSDEDDPTIGATAHRHVSAVLAQLARADWRLDRREVDLR
jgi:hypothetical protein